MAEGLLRVPRRLDSASGAFHTVTAASGDRFLAASGVLGAPPVRAIRRAALVSCGGLCPGINSVLFSLATLLESRGTEVYGVRDGYRGFKDSIARWQWTDQRRAAGSVLRCSRGGWDLEMLKSAIRSAAFDALFIVGGDGTHRGIALLSEALPECTVVGVPKTIDNDVYGFDRCFGFESAVDVAKNAVQAADAEARGVDMGVGVVRLMGRHSGHIALAASVAYGDVDICLIPEVPATVPRVIEYAREVLKRQRKCVVVVAEGCSLGDPRLQSPGTDYSGNPILADVGALLQQELKLGLRDLSPVVRYIDPSYLLRGCEPVTSDLRLCAEMAVAAVAGAQAGYSGFSVGPVAGQLALVPVSYIVYDSEGRLRTRNPLPAAALQLQWCFRQPSLG